MTTTEIAPKRKPIHAIVAILLGLTFLFSAFSKTIPITPFIDSIYERFPMAYPLAAALARAIIGLEAGLGILFIIGLNGKWRWVLYSSLTLLIAFTTFIIGIWYVEGSEADCGCLGEVVKLSPFWSIVKNVVMMLAVILLIGKDKRKESNARYYFAWIITAVFLCYPFIFVPGELAVDRMYPVASNDTLQAPPVDLREGKHIVAFMSLTCKHCLNAGTKLAEMYKEDPTLPIIFIFPQPKEAQISLVDTFLTHTASQDVPRHFIPMSIFREMAGRGVPSIYMLDGTAIEDKIDNYKIIKTKQLQEWNK